MDNDCLNPDGMDELEHIPTIQPDPILQQILDQEVREAQGDMFI